MSGSQRVKTVLIRLHTISWGLRHRNSVNSRYVCCWPWYCADTIRHGMLCRMHYIPSRGLRLIVNATHSRLHIQTSKKRCFDCLPGHLSFASTVTSLRDLWHSFHRFSFQAYSWFDRCTNINPTNLRYAQRATCVWPSSVTRLVISKTIKLCYCDRKDDRALYK